MTVTYAALWPFFTVLMRLGGAFMTAPGFSNLQAPMRIRLGALLACTFLLGSALGEKAAPPADSFILSVLFVELVIGVGIGLAFRFTMLGVEAAGELAGLQMGMGIASTIDPASGNNALFTHALFAMLYTALFLALDGHHTVLRTIFASYEIAPPGRALDLQAGPLQLIDQSAQVILIGLRLAAGFIVPLMAVTFAMALISRVFPQANVFVLSYAASLLVGLTLFATTTPAVRAIVAEGIRGGAEGAGRWIRAAAGV
ncbi:MAG: hypothetical protein AMXMBFR7_31100 [Planctomycetota bacterium]